MLGGGKNPGILQLIFERIKKIVDFAGIKPKGCKPPPGHSTHGNDAALACALNSIRCNTGRLDNFTPLSDLVLHILCKLALRKGLRVKTNR
jgi:hypothetical protein